jgi:hypothetical protein
MSAKLQCDINVVFIDLNLSIIFHVFIIIKIVFIIHVLLVPLYVVPPTTRTTMEIRDIALFCVILGVSLHAIVHSMHVLFNYDFFLLHIVLCTCCFSALCVCMLSPK